MARPTIAERPLAHQKRSGGDSPAAIWRSASAVGWAGAVCLAVLVCVLGVAFANPEIAGFYHDDGIYALTGKALATREGYRLINLPSAPPATKYPPLYPVLLSLVWRVAPEFPANLPALKAVNAVLLAVLVPLVYAWTGRLRFPVPERLLACALIGISPGLFWFSDIMLSEPLFVVLAVALFVVVEDGRPWTMRRAVLAGVLAGVAMLTRVPAMALAVAAAAVVGWTGGRRALLAFAAGAVVMAAPWWVWRWVNFAEVGPLEAYYVAYEPSAWGRIVDDPAFTGRVAGSNARFFLNSAPLVFGLPGPVFVVLGCCLAVTGAWSLRRTRTAALGVLWFSVTAIGLLGHPYPMARYLTPFVPIIYILMTSSFTRIRGGGGMVPKGGRGWIRTLAVVPAAFLLAANIVWVTHHRTVVRASVHGEFGRSLPYSWAHFADAAAWIRHNTPGDARLASGHDPFYALHTGRPAVRPWLHRPEHYTAASEGPPFGTEASKVSGQLERLGVCYLVRDPLLEDGEGEWGRGTMAAILADDRGWRVSFSVGSTEVWRRTTSQCEPNGLASIVGQH